MFKNLNLLLVGMKSRTSHLHHPLDANWVKWRKSSALCLLTVCAMPLFADELEAKASISGINVSQINQVTQQKASVKGQVKDANGEALVGVNVTVKGSQTGTVTKHWMVILYCPNTGTDATLVFLISVSSVRK